MLAIGPSGTLLERHTPGARSDRWSKPHRMGRPGSWSTQAAPAVTPDVAGHVWVAAVTRRGTLQSQHTTHDGRRWTGFRPVDHMTWSITSTPALADAPDGRVWLASVARRGDLVVRHTGSGAGRWERGHWLAGQWSPYSSPSLTVDRSGRTWLAAVATDGHPAVISTPAGPQRWHRSRGLPQAARSETEQPDADRHGRWRAGRGDRPGTDAPSGAARGDRPVLCPLPTARAVAASR